MKSDTYNQKECPASETIKKIRDILHNLGIHLHESQWNNFSYQCFSVRLVDNDFPFAATNGKGITRDFALASAYAEFMERLQASPGSMIFRNFGLMPGQLTPPDQTEMTFHDLKTVLPSILETIFPGEPPRFNDQAVFRCVPYYNVFADKMENLPEDLVSLSCASNGLCAGNSAAEAIIQGICEIFERVAIQHLWSNPTSSLPTIPLHYLQHSTMLPTLKEITSRGFQVLVKDGTLGGTIPVLGLLIFDKTTASYNFRFGSAPTFDMALQRCLTEWFQGKNRVNSPDWMQPINWNDDDFLSGQFQKTMSMTRLINEGTGKYIQALFTDADDVSDEESQQNLANVFLKSFSNHKETLSYLVGLVRSQGVSLYIRDLSFLGFPTFRVYIRGLSEIDRRGCRIFFENKQEFLGIRQVLLNLKNSRESEMEACVHRIEGLLEKHGEIDRQSFIERVSGIITRSSSDFVQLYNIDFLLTLLCHGMGDAGKAYRYMNRFLGSQRSGVTRPGEMPYYWCVLVYFKLCAQGKDEKQVRGTLGQLFGEGLAGEVLRDMGEPAQVWADFRLPQCGNCQTCPIREECYYEVWSKRVDMLQKKMAGFSPGVKELKALFQC